MKIYIVGGGWNCEGTDGSTVKPFLDKKKAEEYSLTLHNPEEKDLPWSERSGSYDFVWIEEFEVDE
jgi:hypothetical protein